MTKISALALTALALVGVGPAGGEVGDLYALRYGAKMNLVRRVNVVKWA